MIRVPTVPKVLAALLEKLARPVLTARKATTAFEAKPERPEKPEKPDPKDHQERMAPSSQQLPCRKDPLEKPERTVADLPQPTSWMPLSHARMFFQERKALSDLLAPPAKSESMVPQVHRVRLVPLAKTDLAELPVNPDLVENQDPRVS